jgi:sugar-specific transcriptional regulator TrmB
VSSEAEQNNGERERLVQKLRELIENCSEFERDLQAREAEAGSPTYNKSKPIGERMAAVGMSQEAIDLVKTCMGAITSGRGDELPDYVKSELAAIVRNIRKA